MVALGRKYDTGIFLSPTEKTCFLYLYTCYLDEDYVPRYARNFVLYEMAMDPHIQNVGNFRESNTSF